MRKMLPLLLAALAFAAPGVCHARRPHFPPCTGAADCRVCKDCTRCRHCHREGGTCGVKRIVEEMKRQDERRRASQTGKAH